MQRRGFARAIAADDGSAYQLPPAEYNFEGSVTRADVLGKAKAAAAAVKPSYEVLVTESAGRTWYNLKTVKKAVA